MGVYLCSLKLYRPLSLTHNANYYSPVEGNPIPNSMDVINKMNQRWVRISFRRQRADLLIFDDEDRDGDMRGSGERVNWQ